MAILFSALVLTVAAAGQQPQQQVAEWTEGFDGATLDEQKWERYSLEGAAQRLEVKDGQLHLRGVTNSRAGVRSRQRFEGDRFIFEAKLAKVQPQMPEPGSSGFKMGHAVLAVMFDGNDRERVEWVFNTEGLLEAWNIREGRGERLDNNRLATKEKDPALAIVRRGDDFLFVLNGEVGLQKTLRNRAKSFQVMLYGFGTSDTQWDSVRVVTMK